MKACAILCGILLTSCYRGSAADDGAMGEAGSEGASDDVGEGPDDDDGDDDDDGPDDDDDDDDGPDPAACDEPGPHTGPATLVRLSLRQYDATVRDLLGVDSGVAQATFAADLFLDEHSKFTSGAPVSPLVAKQLMLGAEAIAEQVDVGALTGCDPALDEDCVDDVLVTLGRRGFRRPLAPAEHDALREIYDAEPDHEAATRAVIEAILQAPQFLFVMLPDTAQADPGDVVALDDDALASRLSYFVWGTMPDDALLDAAEAGELTDPHGLTAQLQRMLADPRATAGRDELYGAVALVDLVGTLTKNPDAYPEFTASIAVDLQTSLHMGLAALHTARAGTLEDLARDLPFFVNANLAEYYGLAVSPRGEEFVAAPTRGGLLAHPAIASLLSKPTEPAIVERGLFVRDHLLCAPLPPPPPGVETELPEPDEGATPREHFEQHRSDPACSGCHDLIDPLGYGMENYDGDGRWRTHYPAGQPIDASGELIASETHAFDDLPGLETALSAEPGYTRCMTRHWLAQATRRVPGPLDACAVQDIETQVTEAGGDLDTLVHAVVLSDAFRHVRVPE